jgi:hypothetical protein
VEESEFADRITQRLAGEVSELEEEAPEEDESSVGSEEVPAPEEVSEDAKEPEEEPAPEDEVEGTAEGRRYSLAATSRSKT